MAEDTLSGFFDSSFASLRISPAGSTPARRLNFDSSSVLPLPNTGNTGLCRGPRKAGSFGVAQNDNVERS